jgi:hypothetical protein
LEAGHLTLYAPLRTTLPALMRMVDHGLRGQLRDCPDLEVISAASFKLRLSKSKQIIAVDGELVEVPRELLVRLLEGQLKVVVSGDLTQRARKTEFDQYAAFAAPLGKRSIIAVAGNHDMKDAPIVALDTTDPYRVKEWQIDHPAS